jgi:predicted ester cyclase
MNIKEFAEKFAEAEKEAWKKGNFKRLEAMENPDVVYHIPSLPDVVGFEGHKQYIQNTVQAVSDLWQEFNYLVGDGNLFAFAYKSSARVAREMPGLPVPVGKKLSTNYLCLFHLKGGKVGEVWMNGSMSVED